MARPTVHDIAKEAGVSLATVDRVLNARPGVRKQTIARVRDAVERLGYVRDTHAANLARRKQYQFAFILPEGTNQFASSLRDTLKEIRSLPIADRVTPKVVRVPHHDPHAIVRSLQRLDTSKLDGVAIMLPETPQVRDAVDRLKEQGLAVVTIVSDLPNSKRDYFIGITNLSAGRTAGLLMGRMAPPAGDVLVVTNSLRSRDSLERRLGFDQVLTEDFPQLNALPTIESYDDPRRLEEIIDGIAASRSGLVGVYSMGPGNRALLQALRGSGLLDEVVFLAHELTPTTREALISGSIAAVIMQNVGHLVRGALRVLRALCDDLPIYEAQERVRIEIVLRENLP